MTTALSQLCAHVGVHAQYRGFDGQMIHVSSATQRAVLRAMGLSVDTDADAQTTLAQMQAAQAARPLPHDVIVQAGIAADLTLSQPVTWALHAHTGDGDGAILAQGQAVDRLALPALPMGIHRLHLSSGSGSREHITWVLARPDRAVQLADHIPTPRIWGGLTALYGLTDGANANIGSYAHLGDYAAAIAQYGADFLGINPVHAMGHSRPDDVISPYSPSHRALLNTWHCAGSATHADTASDLVDYPTALAANQQALAQQYAAFCALPAAASAKQAYADFVAQADASLDEFALFEALSARFGADWRDWPTPYRNHDASALAVFAADHADAIAQTKWAQWQADVQLAAAQHTACAAGMRVGLYLDLAVGPRLGGAETWEKDTSLVTGATLGAPPDPLGPDGQSWGLAPLSPLKCRDDGYAGFTRLLRSIMRHAGMIRIDHVLGLMRSFWIPDGASEGTFVDYPCDALLAVVAIESRRNNTIVVGEDLGLVPDGLRQKLAAAGIYGLDVLQYMRTATGGFVDPKSTRAIAVCTFATHDTPTIAGFFAAQDACVRYELGGIDAAALAATRADRTRAYDTLDTAEPVAGVHGLLAMANANMVAVQLDDVAKQTQQQNLPGTIDSHPNWRRKSPFTLDDISTSDDFDTLGKVMHAQGRSNLLRMEQNYDLSDCSDHAN